MTDNLENELSPRPWANARLGAIITTPEGVKKYIYTMSRLEEGLTDLVLGATHPDLELSLIDEPPMFEYTVGVGIMSAVLVEAICLWEQSSGATVESYL